MSKDPFPKSFKFNAEHYATLVANSAPFHKYPEPFLCLIGISRNYTLDEDTYPQFLRKNGEGGCLLLCLTYVLPFYHFADRLILSSFRVEMDLLSFIQIANPTKVRVGERQRAEDEPKLMDTTVGRIIPLLPIALARTESELDASVDSEAAETVVEDVAPL
ncbi:hypothetical protein Tco_1480859 [Tanacetum coccineum]